MTQMIKAMKLEIMGLKEELDMKEQVGAELGSDMRSSCSSYYIGNDGTSIVGSKTPNHFTALNRMQTIVSSAAIQQRSFECRDSNQSSSEDSDEK
jgi:hypothetical protein